MSFDHENLDVYHAAIEFTAKADDIIEQLPRGRGYLADQLQRAALSIESAAVHDVCGRLKLVALNVISDNKALLVRIVQMLTQLIKSRRTSNQRSPVPVPVPEPVPDS